MFIEVQNVFNFLLVFYFGKIEASILICKIFHSTVNYCNANRICNFFLEA